MPENILIIDDKTDHLRVLLNVLTGAGYRVRPTNQAHAALRAARAAKPDLILLDIMMPEMNGYEICQQLKATESTHDIPVIFISALNDSFDKVKAFQLGGVDYITKPFQTDEVLARVSTHLTLQRLQKQLRKDNKNLETRVQERTIELERAYQQLKAEMEDRQQQQAEKETLYEVVWQQSEQLRTLSQYLLQYQRHHRAGLAQTLYEQTEQNLTLLQSQLATMQTILAEITPSNFISVSQMLAQQLSHSHELLTQTIAQTQEVAKELNQPTEQETQLGQNPLLMLSDREREVLQLWRQGHSIRKIAELLSLSVNTIYTYRHRMMQKLNIDNLPELVQFAIQHE